MIPGVVLLEFQNCLKHIAVDDDLEASTADLCIAFGDGETQSVSVCSSGFIPANKALGYFLGIKIQGICGDVFELDLDYTILFGGGDKHTGVL